MSSQLSFQVGSDVGGTFTDLWVRSSDGRTTVVKAPSTSDVIGGVIAALKLAAEELDLTSEDFCARIDRFGHGTTVGLNALLTGRFARTVIITTRGFADTLEIGRLRRQAAGLAEGEVTNYYGRGRWRPLVSRNDVLEVDERIDEAGDIVLALDEDGARQMLERLAGDGVDAVAICTLWSTVNDEHEEQLRALVTEALPGAAVSVSHEISHTVGEYARMSTTAANAALKRLAGDYIGSLETLLGTDTKLLLMTGAGGVVPGEYLRERPVMALFSGPAAGVIASRNLAERIGRTDVLTIDIGGTSFDVGLIAEGRVLMTSEVKVAGADIRMPTIDVRSIGAGGGSIAWVRDGELRLGPQSAGAEPGPACYGRGGTEPTATDADLVVGVLDPETFLGGRMHLDPEASRRVIKERVADPLGLDVVHAAWGIREVMTSRMADLLRQVTIERGYDPRDFTMFAGGGSGPTYAAALARELGLREIVVPATATAQSAFGTGTSDLRMTAERTVAVHVRTGSNPSGSVLNILQQSLEEAAGEVRDALAAQALTTETRIEVTFAVRYRGQSHNLDIPVVGHQVDETALVNCLHAFEQHYESLFGRGAAFPEAGFEIVSVRAEGTGRLADLEPNSSGEAIVPTGSRLVVFDDPTKPLETPIYAAEIPRDGEHLDGPALIEFPGHTVVVPPGWSARSDEHANLILARSE